MGCVEVTWVRILRSPTTLNWNKNSFYVRYGVISWHYDKIINGSFGGILGQFRFYEALGINYMSCRTHRKVLGEKYDRARNRQKRSKLKAIRNTFRRPRDPCTECRGMPRGDIGWYIKVSHVFEREQEQLFWPFWVISWLHDKNYKWVIWWHSEAIQIVQSTRDAL